MADSGSMRLRSVQAPIIPLVDQLIQQYPGTISFGQGVVHYGPPDQAKKRLQDFWSDAAHHKYGPILGAPPLQACIRKKLEKENQINLSGRSIVVTAGSNMGFLNLVLAITDPGDEVILPNRSWIATAHAVTILGGKVILADVEKSRPLLASDRLEELISTKTKAVIPVHLNGRAADLRKIQEISGFYEVPVIEDAAQAIGSQYQNALLGTFGTIGCFSFSVAKTLATGQGGVAITEDDNIAGSLRAMRTHGVENVKDPGKWQMPGSNFRFTDIAASIGLVQ